MPTALESLHALLISSTVLCAHPATPVLGVAPQVQQVWDGDALVEGEYPTAQLTRQTGNGPATQLQAPPGCIGLTYWRGHCTALRQFNEKILLARKSPNTDWSLSNTSLNEQGEASGLRGMPMSLHEAAKPDHFLAMNVHLGFRQGPAASPLSGWRLGSDDTLRPLDILPLDLDGPVFTPTPPQSYGACMALSPRQAGLAPFLEFPLRVPGAFVVASLGAGVLWTISDDTLKVHRVIRLLPMLTERLAARADHPRAIHALQPTPAGQLLVALRSREALVETRDRSRKAQALEKVEWREVDPLTGTVQDAPAALLHGAPQAIPAGGAFTFRLNAQGWVLTQ